MKKILLIVLGILGFSFNFSLAEDLPQLVLFYGETCPHCKAEEGYLDSLKEIYHFEVVGYEVYYSEENREKMKEYGEQFGTEFNGVPVVIMGNDYFLGASYDKTVALLEKYTHKIGDDSCQPEEDVVNQNTNPIVECTGDDKTQNTSPVVTTNTGAENTEIITGDIETETGDVVETGNVIENEGDENLTKKIFGKEFSLGKTGPILFGIVLGFADGINPCMFGVLMFLLTYLASIGSKKKMLYSGLIFAATTFVIYYVIMYLLHIELFKNSFFIEHMAIVHDTIGILAVIFGLIEIKDFFWYGKGVSLAIPKWAKPTLEYVTKKGTYMSAFILAILSTFVELGCTAMIPLTYLNIIKTNTNIFLALGVYNFFFILPLIFIILGFYFGIPAFKSKDGDLAINKVSNKKIMRLVAGIILITLGVLFLTRVI